MAREPVALIRVLPTLVAATRVQVMRVILVPMAREPVAMIRVFPMMVAMILVRVMRVVLIPLVQVVMTPRLIRMVIL